MIAYACISQIKPYKMHVRILIHAFLIFFLAFVGLCGPVLAVVAFVGLCGPSWAFVRPLWACFGPMLAFVGPRGPALACMGSYSQLVGRKKKNKKNKKKQKKNT